MIITKLQQGLTKFVADNSIRPELACVKADGQSVTATDSFRLVEMKNVTTPPQKTEPEILISAKTLACVKGKKGFDSMEVTKTKDMTLAKTPEATYILDTTTPADEYPRLNDIWQNAEKQDAITVKLNGRMLAEICAHLSKLDYNETVTLHVPKKPLTSILIKATGSGHEARAILMPMNH